MRRLKGRRGRGSVQTEMASSRVREEKRMATKVDYGDEDEEDYDDEEKEDYGEDDGDEDEEAENIGDEEDFDDNHPGPSAMRSVSRDNIGTLGGPVVLHLHRHNLLLLHCHHLLHLHLTRKSSKMTLSRVSAILPCSIASLSTRKEPSSFSSSDLFQSLSESLPKITLTTALASISRLSLICPIEIFNSSN